MIARKITYMNTREKKVDDADSQTPVQACCRLVGCPNLDCEHPGQLASGLGNSMAEKEGWQ